MAAILQRRTIDIERLPSAAGSRSPSPLRRMATPLDKPLKRALQIDGKPYTLTIDADGLRLVEKGRRKGQELRWSELVSGEAALAVALNASLARAH